MSAVTWMSVTVLVLALCQVGLVAQLSRLRKEADEHQEIVSKLLITLSDSVLSMAKTQSTSPPYDYVPHSWLFQPMKEQPAQEESE